MMINGIHQLLLPCVMYSKVLDGAVKVFETRCHWLSPGVGSTAGCTAISFMISPFTKPLWSFARDCTLAGRKRRTQFLVKCRSMTIEAGEGGAGIQSLAALGGKYADCKACGQLAGRWPGIRLRSLALTI